MRLYFTFVLLWINYNSIIFAQNTQTFSFKTVNNQTLELDYYYQSTNTKSKKPTIIFVHGGSFKQGSKNSVYIAPFANKWVKAGYNFVAINYRLTLKDKSFHCDCPKEEKIRTFEHAVYDIRAATNFLINNKKKFNIDDNKIILAGNSAGAEAILHAAFWKNNEHNISSPLLSINFKYAGVIAFAGAIIDTNLITKQNAIPIALYHGTCDPYVPYKTATHHYCADSTPGALVLSGSYDIMKRVKNLNKSFLLFSTCGAKHEINTKDIYEKVDQTILFINKTVVKNNFIQEHQIIKSSKEKCKFVEVEFCD